MVKIKLKKKYKMQFYFSFSGGIILFLVGAVGSAAFYESLVRYGIEFGYFPEEYAELIILVLKTLAILGGITVIIGGLIYGFIANKSIGNFFVSVGAGISITILIIRLINLGPLLREYFWNQQYIEILIELGFGIGLQGLGTLLAFLALLKYYKPLAVGFVDGMLLTIAGVVISPEEIIVYIENYVTLSDTVESVLYKLIWGVSLAGTAMLIASLIFGAGFIKIGKIISTFVFIFYMPQYIPMVLAKESYELVFTTATLSFTLSTISVILLIYLIRYKPKKPGEIKLKDIEKKKRKKKS